MEKSKVFKEMSAQELDSKLQSLKQELYTLRFNHATGQLTNPKLLTSCKRDIARVMTEIRAKQIAGLKQAQKKA